jgi:3-phenylpropionate/trans-cinnamate dioxygenase ferredoxin component
MTGTDVRVAASHDVPEGEGRRFEIDGRAPVAIFRVEGALYAIDDRCTHGAASLADGWLEGDQIECPVHQGRFCLRSGKPMCFPVTEPVAVHGVAERDGSIYLTE